MKICAKKFHHLITNNNVYKLVHNVGTIHGHDISNDLLYKKRLNIDKPKHTQDALDEYQLVTNIRDQAYKRLAKYCQF